MNKKNKVLLTLALVAASVAAPVQKAEARGFRHHGGFHHCHSSRHFWGGVAGGLVGGLVGGYVARPYYYSTPVVTTPYYSTPVVTTPYYSTPVVSYPTTTVVQPQVQPVQQAPKTIVKEVIKDVPAPVAQPKYPKLNPGESMTIKPDGTIIVTRGSIAPIPAKTQQNQR